MTENYSLCKFLICIYNLHDVLYLYIQTKSIYPMSEEGMKTQLTFYKATTQDVSDYNAYFEVMVSSEALKWDGIILERATASHFSTSNVQTPYFFFSMEISNDFSLSAGEGNTSVITEAGDIWIHPPNAPFTHQNLNSAEFLLLAIDEKTLFSHIDGFIPYDKLEYLVNYNVRDPHLQHMMNLFLSEVENKGVSGKAFLNNLLKLFCNYFIQNYTNLSALQHNQSQISVISSGQMDNLRTYICENISENILIEDMAKVVHMNKFHFLKEFKKLSGITPYQYIIQVRVDCAKSKLKDLNTSIIDIAMDLGFNDSSHFSRTFKKLTKRTPLQYRKML